MRRTLITAAILAASASVHAQSSVALFGIVDARLAIGKGSVADRTALDHSGTSSSRIGFRGTEDLGGGLRVSFHLEAGISPDTGQGAATNTNNQASGVTAGNGLTFNRRSTVSLGGGWGELRLGRDYTANYHTLSVFDPFGAVGVGQNQSLDASLAGIPRSRVSNAISYFSPGCSSSAGCKGFHGQAQVYLGENASNAATPDDGDGYSVRGGWGAGPLSIAVATGRTRYAAGNVRISNLGGRYDFGKAAVNALYNVDKVDGGATGKGYLVGVTVPQGSGVLKASISRYGNNAAGDPRSTKLALGYVHHLSKRTAAYVTYAHLRNRGGARAALNRASTAPDGSSSGLDIGLRHSF
jgi:predicted porin